MSTPRPTPKVRQTAPEGKAPRPALTAGEVRERALDLLTEHLSLPRPGEARYGLRDLFAVLLYAAAHRMTLEQACAALKEAPHPNTLRGALPGAPLEELEEQLNAALAHTLPPGLDRRPWEVAADLKLIPYYGEPHPGGENFLLRGRAREGTTTFFGYASLYLIRKHHRYTLAVVAVRRGEGPAGVLERLWTYARRLGLRLRCLYLDRGFYSVAVLRWLKERDLPFVLAAPKRGKQGGIRGLIERKGPGVWPYTVHSPAEGAIRVQVAVVGKYRQGRWGKRGRDRYAFVIHRFPFALSGLWERYRRRFGIESAHRVWEQARARTASRRAGLRLLLVGIAVLLHNLWVFLKWTAVSRPRRGRGGREVWEERLRFVRLLSFLSRAIERWLGAVEEIILPVPSA